MTNLYKIKSISIKIIILAIIVSGLFSCSTTRYLKEGEQLLVKNKVEINKIDSLKSDIGFETYEIEDLIKPKVNSKLLGMKIYLRIYNLYSPKKIEEKEKKQEQKCKQKIKNKVDKLNSEIKNIEYWRNQYTKGTKEYLKLDKKLKKKQTHKNIIKQEPCKQEHWTQTSGEAPVLYSTNQEYRNIRQIRIFLKNKGYYNAIIKAEKNNKTKKKAIVKYTITTNTPYRLNSIDVFCKDTAIYNLVKDNREKSLIKEGGRIDIENLEKERSKITSYLRNNGYYKFAKEYIFYSIDSTHANFKADLTINIKQVKNINGTKIKGISIYEDSLYQISHIKESYKYLSSLKIIKIANIEFTEIVPDTTNNNEPILLDCNIKLTQNMRQAYTVELEGTNTSGNIGMAGSMTYSHLNIFRNAEVFDFNIKGSLERQGNVNNSYDISDLSNIGFFNSRELGVDFSFIFPRMLAPSKFKKMIKRYNPKTSLSTNFNYLVRPDYTRTVAGINFGYKWNSADHIKHIFKPILLDLVKMKNPTPEFIDYIYRLNLFESYEDHLIFGTAYSIIINKQLQDNKKVFTYLRINGKAAGNTLAGVMLLTNIEKQNESYKIGGNTFAQFVKADIDFRIYKKLKRENDKLVFRTFGGLILPYGNLAIAPFGEKYFSGGANGIRAWQVRSLGPGSYILPVNTGIYPNQTADIKLEANFEYRMKLFWMLEGAFFIDAGNIWATNSHNNIEGSLFEINDFYKEIAIGTGVGFRFDFDFFIIRFDFGLKLKDPALEVDKRWIRANRPFNSDDWTFNIGIGYPF